MKGKDQDSSPATNPDIQQAINLINQKLDKKDANESKLNDILEKMSQVMDSQLKQKDDIQSTITDIYSKIADLTKEVQEIKR